MSMDQTIRTGFVYTVEVIDRDGNVVDREVIKNLMPIEGINYLLNAGLKGGAAVSAWYIGLYEGNYTPTSADTMAAFPAAATETTAYTGTRKPFTSGTVANGAVDNSASKAEFTMTSAKTIYGGFVSSASAKSSTSGTLLSAVKFSTAKVLEVDSILRITAGFTAVSA